MFAIGACDGSKININPAKRGAGQISYPPEAARLSESGSLDSIRAVDLSFGR